MAVLRRIEVSGFKSLVDFELDVRPGLNVLVGANGAGKSNIVQFLGFLSDLVSDDFAAAFERLGGAGNVFSRRPDGKPVDELTFSAQGRGQVRRSFGPAQAIRLSAIDYSYGATISVLNNFLFFSSQSILIRLDNQIVPALSVAVTYDPAQGFVNDQFDRFDPAALNFAMPEESWHDVIKAILRSRDGKGQSSILKNLSSIMTITDFVSADLDVGRASAIDPRAVRAPESLGRQPGIKADGSGLASTLRAFERQFGGDQLSLGDAALFTNDLISKYRYDKIQSLCRLVTEDIEKLYTREDPFDRTVRVYVAFKDADGSYELPISLVSDGTAKWFALMTALLMSEHGFCIEEPENYLHPKLQEDIVDIARSCAESAEDDRFVLMTTHSQTLLDAVLPEELIVVSRRHVRTRCSRLLNSSALEEIISETGSGLGHFYVADALET
jgi:predicted ATPase